MSITEIARSRDEFIKLEDGYTYWFPTGSDKGCLAAHHLRELADELDNVNESWDEIVKSELSK